MVVMVGSGLPCELQPAAAGLWSQQFVVLCRPRWTLQPGTCYQNISCYSKSSPVQHRCRPVVVHQQTQRRTLSSLVLSSLSESLPFDFQVYVQSGASKLSCQRTHCFGYLLIFAQLHNSLSCHFLLVKPSDSFSFICNFIIRQQSFHQKIFLHEQAACEYFMKQIEVT